LWTPCSLAGRYQDFKGTGYLVLQAQEDAVPEDGNVIFLRKVVCYSAVDGLMRGNNANILYSFFFNFLGCRNEEKEKRLKTSFKIHFA